MTDELFQPHELADLPEAPEFKALPYQQRMQVFERAAREANQFVTMNGGWTPEAFTGFRQSVKSLRQRVADSESYGEKAMGLVRTMGEVMGTSLAAMGTSGLDTQVSLIRPSVSGGFALGGGKPSWSGGVSDVGAALNRNMGKVSSSVRTVYRDTQGTADEEVEAELDSLDEAADSGAVLNDPKTWIKDRADRLAMLQAEYHRQQGENPETPPVASYLQENRLDSKANLGLLLDYLGTGNPQSREALRKNLLKTWGRAQLESGDERATKQSLTGQLLDTTFGQGASRYVSEAGDPFEIVQNVTSLWGGKVVGATIKAGLRSFLKGAGQMAGVAMSEGASELGSQFMDSPHATSKDYYRAAHDAAIGSLGLAGLGAGYSALAERNQRALLPSEAAPPPLPTSASVTSGPGATTPMSEGAPRGSSAGAGSSPAAGSSSLASIARAAGERVPMSPQPSFAETAARDAAYFAAVNRGDMETAQRMVDEAAKAAGYNQLGFHNTNAQFNEFRPSTSGKLGPGIYWSMTPRPKFGARTIRAWIKIQNPLNAQAAPDAYLKKMGNFVLGVKEDAVERGGFDSVIFSDTENVIKSPHQIKSAEPVTYDEAGNIIPLSRRFNPATPNIQYSFAETALSGATGAVAGVVAAPHLGLTSEEGAFVGTGVGIQLDALGNIIGIAYDALTAKETPSVGAQVPWADLPRREPVNWDLPPPEAGGSLPKTVRRELPLPSNEPAPDSPALPAPGPAEAAGVSARSTPGRDERAGTARGGAAETGAVSRPPGEVGTASVSRTIRSAAREHGASVEVDDTVADPTIEVKPDGSRTLKLPTSAVETLSKLPPAERRRAYRALRRRLAAHAAGNLDALFAKLREAYHQSSALGDLVKQVLDLLAKAKQPTRRRTGANTKPKGSSALASAVRSPKMRARMMEDLFTLIAGHLRNEALPLPQEPGEPSPKKTLRKFVKAIAEGKLGEEMRDLAVKAREENRSRTTREAKAKVEKTVEDTVAATPEAPKVDVYTGPEEVPLSGTPEEELTSVDLEKPVFYDRTTGGFGVIVRNLEPLPGETIEQAAKRELEDAMRRRAGLPRATLPPTVPLSEEGYTFMRALHEVADRFGVYFTGHSSLSLPDVTFLGNQQAGLQVAVSRHYANEIAQLPDPAQRRLHLDAFRAKMALHSVWNSEWRADTRTGYTTHLQDKAIPRTWAALKQLAATDHTVADGIRAVLELRAGMRLREETIEAEMVELDGSVDEQLAFMEDMARALSQRHRGHPLTEAADGTHLVRDPVGRDRILRQLDGANRALRRAGVPEWSDLLEGMEATLDNQSITTSRHRAATRALDALRQTFPALAANVHIVDTLPDMEYAGFERARFTDEDWADISAGYTEGIRDPESDTIVIIASQISVQPGESVEQAARRVVLHETAHRALQAARTQGGRAAQEWNSIVADVLKAHPAEIAHLRGMGSIYGSSDASQIVDEWAVRKLASMTPEQLRAVPRASALGRVVQWLKDLWRRLLGRAPSSERLMQDVVTFYQKGVAALAQSQVPVPVEYADTWSWTPEDGRLTRIVTGQHDPPRRAAMQTGMKKEAQALAKVPGVGRLEIHADLSTLTTDGSYDETKLTPEQWVQARYHRQPVLITDRGVVVIMDHVAVRPEDAYDAKGRPVSLEMQTRRALRREIDTARARDAANFLRTLPGWEAFTNQLWDTHAEELGRIAEAQVPEAHAQWHRLADTHSTEVLREGELQAYRHDIAARWFTRALATGELADAQVSRFKELLDGALLTALRPTLAELGSPIDALAAQLDEAKTMNAARQWAAQAQAYFEQTSAVIRAGKQPLMAGEKAANSQFMKDSLETAKVMAAAGKSSEEIRAVTGWFPGRYDGKMRWELPDEGAMMTTKAVTESGEYSGTVGEALFHRALYEAYPAAAKVPLRLVIDRKATRSGAFEKTTVNGIPHGGSIRIIAPNYEVAKSVLLHEIQHWIQEQEGFARGGHPKGEALLDADISKALERNPDNEKLLDAIERFESAGRHSNDAKIVDVASGRKSDDFTVSAAKNYKAAKEHLEAVLGELGFTRTAAYRRTAGEIEARDVQARQSYTPEQRAAIAPYSSENIAPEDAIVIYDSRKSFSYAGEKAANSQFMKDSLETAKAMAAAGKSSEEIRAVTGWFPGKYDGKMRWELPDEGANATFKMKWKDAHSFLTRERDGLIRQATVGDVLDHPKLFKAYPEVRNVVVTVQDHPGGSFGARGIAIDGEVAGNEAVFASTLLHEIQHWIQEKEGFARGGNTEEGIGKAIYSSDTILRAKLFLEGEGISPDEDYGFSDQADYVELAREKGWMGAPKNPRRSKTGVDYYGRLAGEIEARDVEARQSYTPEQRKAIAPYSSENIAPEDAIVLYGAGTAQMMPQLSKAGDRTEVFYQGTGPFRVAAPKWRQILTGRLLPKELAEVQQMTKDEMGALKASAARLAKDAQAAILRRVKATGKTELEVHEEMSRAMDDPAEMALLAVSAPDLHAATIALRNMQDNLSDAIAMMTGGKTGAGILNNLGKWSRRGYAVFDADANWNYDSLKAAADAGRKINGLDARKIWDDGRNYLAREQARKHRRWPKLYEAPTPAVLDALMRKLLDRHAWLAAMTGEGKITKDISSLVKRKLDPVKDGALMRLMGVVTNPIERFAASTNFQAQFVSLHQMQQQMRGVMLAMGLASDTMNDVYTVKVGGKEGARNQRWSGFGELWTTPELLGALQSARGVASSADVGHVLLDAFRQLGGEAKAARVAYSPDFWSTNFIGAVMALAGTGDLTLSRKSIRSLAKAWNTMAGAEGIKHSAMPAAERAALDAARELHSRLEASGVINAGFHMEDVLNSLDNQWRNRLTATKPREVVTAAARGALTGAAVGRSFGTVAHVAGAVAGGVAGPLIGAKRLAAFHGTLAKYLVSGPDNFAKLASYLNNYETYARSGLSPAEAHAKAVEVVLNTMPNYAMLPSLMREMSRLGLMGSFIAFRAEALRNLYHNTRYAVQELRSGNPALRARGAARLMGIAFTQSLALGRLAGPFGLLMLMSQADDDEEKAWRETVARPWDANGQPVFLKLDDKEAEYFNAGYLLPQATLAEIINGAVRGQTWETVQAQFVQGNVHLDPLLEAAMNRKRDTGLKVSAYPDGTWQNIAERALWAIHNLEPGYASKLERVSLAALGRSKGSARYDLGNEALRMVGLRLNKVQHEDAIRGDLYGFRDRVATARDLARTKWTQWGGKTADATGRHEQESALAYANREIAQAQADFQIYQDNLGKLGITPEMVRRLMKSRNISLTFAPLKLTPEGPKAAK